MTRTSKVIHRCSDCFLTSPWGKTRSASGVWPKEPLQIVLCSPGPLLAAGEREKSLGSSMLGPAIRVSSHHILFMEFKNLLDQNMRFVILCPCQCCQWVCRTRIPSCQLNVTKVDVNVSTNNNFSFPWHISMWVLSFKLFLNLKLLYKFTLPLQHFQSSLRLSLCEFYFFEIVTYVTVISIFGIWLCHCWQGFCSSQ